MKSRPNTTKVVRPAFCPGPVFRNATDMYCHRANTKDECVYRRAKKSRGDALRPNKVYPLPEASMQRVRDACNGDRGRPSDAQRAARTSCYRSTWNI
jgi:hypothetical protein